MAFTEKIKKRKGKNRFELTLRLTLWPDDGQVLVRETVTPFMG